MKKELFFLSLFLLYIQVSAQESNAHRKNKSENRKKNASESRQSPETIVLRQVSYLQKNLGLTPEQKNDLEHAAFIRVSAHLGLEEMYLEEEIEINTYREKVQTIRLQFIKTTESIFNGEQREKWNLLRQEKQEKMKIKAHMQAQNNLPASNYDILWDKNADVDD